MKSSFDDQKRREELYDFLLSREDKWTSMEETTDTISAYPAFFTTNYHNSYARRMLTGDIEAINSDDSFEKIIISCSRGIKLASSKEFERWCMVELRECLRKIKRVRKTMRKAGRDQQHTIEGEIVKAFQGGGEDG